MLRDADTAMYVAKARGKELVEVFERGMEKPIARRRELRSALERALELDDELSIEYQPIVDMRRFTLLGLEALVRWQHPQLGRLMPADFIPLAEETGLIGRSTSGCCAGPARTWRTAAMLLSVNVSAHQLGDGALPALVGRRPGRQRDAAGAAAARADREHHRRGGRRRRDGAHRASSSWACASRSTTSAPATRPSNTSDACRSTC